MHKNMLGYNFNNQSKHSQLLFDNIAKTTISEWMLDLWTSRVQKKNSSKSQTLHKELTSNGPQIQM